MSPATLGILLRQDELQISQFAIELDKSIQIHAKQKRNNSNTIKANYYLKSPIKFCASCSEYHKTVNMCG